MQRFFRMPEFKKNRGKFSEATKVAFFLFSYVEALQVQRQVKEMEKK
jgi:hypothetical protein